MPRPITRIRTILTGQGEPVRLDGAAVSASIFDVLGVPPKLGRTFRPRRTSRARTRSRSSATNCGSSASAATGAIVGKAMTLDGVAHEIVGVMPEGFSFPAARSIWMPLEYSDDLLIKQRGAWYLTAVGRDQARACRAEQVQAEIETIGTQLATQYPDSNEGVGITAMSLHEAMVGRHSRERSGCCSARSASCC